MPHLIVYLLKANAALMLFYAAYRLGLRRLTFYYLNRVFLVFGIVFSAVYPLVDLSQLFVKHQALTRQLTVFVPDWHAVAPAIIRQAETFDYWQIPILLFWTGVVFMTARLTAQFISLYKIYRKSRAAEYNGQAFRSVGGDINPFSFWQSIFLNPAKHTDIELQAIIKHEQIHVHQWHTLDVLLAELSTVFYWFNPGVWLMKQAVKENLEFITDREILRSGVDEKSYQYSLVMVSSLRQCPAIVNNFNFVTVKQRIMMMHKKRSSKAQVTRYVVLLPVVVALALIFTLSKAELSNKSISRFVKNVLPKAIISRFSVASVSVKSKSAKNDTIPNTKLSVGQPKQKGNTNPGNNTALLSNTTGLEQGNAEDSTVVDKKGKTLTLYGKANFYNLTGSVSANVIHVDSGGVIDFKRCLVIINDELKTREAINSINVSLIDSINVIKSEEAVKRYGYKGKYGALEIKLKPSKFSVVITPGVDNNGLTTNTISFAPALANTFSTGMSPGDTFGTRLLTGRALNTGIIQGSIIKSDGDVKSAGDGDVLKVTEISGTYLVLIKKGNYFSAYSNLKSAKVAKGDKVAKGQVIGVAAIDPVTDQTEMQYELYDGVKRIIPADAQGTETNIDYLVNPANTGPEEFERIRKMFREGGFLVEFHQDLNKPDLLEVSIQSKTGKASATFRMNDMIKQHYFIHIGGNITTGDVSVNSQYKPE